jgi:hypothetical protein
MIFFLGVIIKEGKGSLLFIIIVLIIIINLRFSRLNIYSSFTLINIITYYLIGYLTYNPDSFIFNIFLPFIILYSAKVIKYFLN